MRWLLELCIGVNGKPPWIVHSRPDLTLVVTARTEDEARQIADKHDEDRHRGEMPEGVKHPWLSKQYSRATPIADES